MEELLRSIDTDSWSRRKIIKDCVTKTYTKKGVSEREMVEILNTKFPGFKDWYVLYDEDNIFQFYSKSADVKPGKGAGEVIQDDFSDLAEHKNWRKKLSNFWNSEFILDGLRWSSVEHYYQGSKFKKQNHEFYKDFSLDREPLIAKNPDISTDPIVAKGAGGKTGKSRGKLVRPTNIKADSDFFRKRHETEMARAQFAKFSQNDDLKEMLLSTGKAKLNHFLPRSKKKIDVFNTLMAVRADLAFL